MRQWPLALPTSVQAFLDGRTDADTVAEALREWPQPSLLNGHLLSEGPGVDRPRITGIETTNDALGMLAWAETALYAALRAHELMAQHERAASRWIGLAFWARLYVANIAVPSSWTKTYAQLNDDLEREVWQRAYELRLTSPGC